MVNEALLAEDPNFNDFHDLVMWYINKMGITTEEIAARTGIADRTVTSLRAKNAGDVKHDLNLLVALAVGLHMTPEHGKLLINLDGQNLRKSKLIERYYLYLISIGSFYCVAACNDFLVDHGMPPLTDNENICCFE